eukprot:411179-Pyramimonas_sp.AAC.1
MATRSAQEAPRGPKMALRWPQEAPKRPPGGRGFAQTVSGRFRTLRGPSRRFLEATWAVWSLEAVLAEGGCEAS